MAGGDGRSLLRQRATVAQPGDIGAGGPTVQHVTTRRRDTIPGRLIRLFSILAGLSVASAAQAADLRVGTTGTPNLDPHFLLLDTSIAYNQHIYGALTDIDQFGKLHADLAESWTSDGGNVWRFNLRRGVTFHDGTPFTADDVVFSLGRVPNVPNNPAPYTSYILGVTEVRKVDDHTVELVTQQHHPMLPNQIAKLHMISKRAAEGVSTDDFNTGKAAIGTGPYRLVSYTGRDTLVLAPFRDYWGTKPEWDRVQFRVIANDAARVAALLAGDVDLIEAVPVRDAATLATRAGITVHQGSSTRVMFVGVNLTDKSGQQAGPGDNRNPLLDARVRHAMSLAMNRDGMNQSLLNGYGRIASQIGVAGITGNVDDAQPDPLNLEEAKALLQQAGYPSGFATTLTCTNDRYVADAQVCQTVGQLLARIGIRVDVQAIPASVYFGRIRPGNNPSPLFLGAWSNTMGDANYTLAAMFHTRDTERKLGASNRTGWSDAETDRNIEAAIAEPDPAKRVAFLQAAGRRAIDARVAIPLFSAPVLYASRTNITYDSGTAGSSEMTAAMRAHLRN